MALQLPSEIKTLLEDICTTFGATLIDTVLRGTKELMMLELYIDTPEGITLDICEKSIADYLKFLKQMNSLMQLEA